MRALNTLGEPTGHWDTLIIYIIVSKLDSQIEKDWEQYKTIKLEQLLNFLNDKADTLDIIKVHQTSSSQNNSKVFREANKNQAQQKLHSFISTESNIKNGSRVCPLCSKNHLLYTCGTFLKLTFEDRLKFARNKNLCTNCLRAKDDALDCHFGSCKQCSKKHNSLLHGYFSGESATLSSTAPEFKLTSNNNTSTVLHTSDQFKANIERKEDRSKTIILATALVEVAGVDNVYHTARALLDSCSQHCVVTNALRQKINVKTIQSTFRIAGIGHSVSHTTDLSLELEIITRELNINLDYKALNIPQDAILADPSFHLPGEIDLLLGADLFWDLLLDTKIRLRHIYKIQFRDRSFQDIEEIDKCYDVQTHEDLACENLFVETTKRESDGRFSVRIPLKESADVLGDCFEIAKSRFLSLESRLRKSGEYKKMYSGFMQEYANLGHMTKIESNAKPCLFLPHHGVLRHQSITTKLRVVFNASQRTSTGNLNMLHAPTLRKCLGRYPCRKIKGICN
ncbi:uncharacterized protein LOC118733619 [Rhagoletis pomonella]|uniref:uncharacterized protein LOC118733619 n=1 Tax=Rhagoletis pomonella TaxID=28610 RepID=UPI00177E997D|nr:uncharacterized protein LOC118733619 [Rhagoletis pomonella]